MKVKIIDRTEEEKNKSCEESTGISIKELKQIKEEEIDREEKRKELEKQGIIMEYSGPIKEAKIMLCEDIKNGIRNSFNYEKERERKYMKKKMKNAKIPYKSLIKRV